MNRVNSFLMMVIAMVAIMLAAVLIDRSYEDRERKKWEEERIAVYEQARADIEEKQSTIHTLAQDPDALTAYLEENELNYVETYEDEWGQGTEPLEEYEEGMVTEEQLREIELAEGVYLGGVSDNSVLDNSVSGNSVSDNSVSDNSVSDNSVSDNSVSDNSVSDNSVSDNSVSDNSMWGSTVSDNSAQAKEICASYQETIRKNGRDKEIIKNNTVDFSDIKIACLGDSITAGTNLDSEEAYEEMTYPYRLGQLLKAESVVNLGVGGSSIGRYWSNPFVDRYREIPEDTDLIIVMGGTNDGFCASRAELGTLEERKPGTFAGDLDELLRGLKENYPDAVIVLATPLPNILHDMLRKEREELLPQAVFAGMMIELAEEYEIPVIDLYHANLLDTHDAAVIYNYMPDGVHGNSAGYEILAEHMAAEIIRIYENIRQDSPGEGVGEISEKNDSKTV